MTKLVKQRPVAVWFLFLAGAVTGGVSSSLMEPRYVLAEPTDLSGQKFEQLERLVALHDQLLDGISRDESGGVHFRDPLHAIELLVVCNPDSDRPAVSVCGPAVFESSVAASRIVLNDEGPQYPEPDFSGPALQVRGASLFTGDAGPGNPLVAIHPLTIRPGEEEVDFLVKGRSKFTGDAGIDPLMIIMPEVHEGPALVVEGSTSLKPVAGLPALIADGPTGDVCIHPDRIELLVKCGDPDAAVLGTFGFDSLGSYLGVKDILADSVQAYEFVDRAPVIEPF